MAQAFNCRPSDIYRLEHPVLAHDFDTAVWLFGTTLDNDLAETEARYKNEKQKAAARKTRLAVWLDDKQLGYAQPTPGKRKAW
jgi:hypothetical protein